MIINSLSGFIHPKQGFTLVELSIVLVIVGLLIGGILVGQSLVDSAKIQSVIREEQQYEIAIRNFRYQFNGWPGDSTRAGQLLGVLTGNNDNEVDWDSENYYAWQQLAIAGKVNGSYSGTNVSGRPEPGVNIPISKYFEKDVVWYIGGGAGWDMLYSDTTANEGRNQLRLAARRAGTSSTSDHPWVGPLKPEQVLAIDTKIDDSKPGTGNVGSHPPHTALISCVSSALSASAVYVLTSNNATCSISFWLPRY
jgi:prepilin-type N-terminal cleavage/methylation domain-containing protein